MRPFHDLSYFDKQKGSSLYKAPVFWIQGAGKSEEQEMVAVPEEELDNSFAWKDGYLIFNNTPMDDVIKILERWYGVTFNPVNEVIGNYRFTARFKTESITRVLDLLSISSNIKYGINENIITLHK